MSFVKKEMRVPSSDGIHTLSGVVYLPEGEKKGLFQIVHGMTEYIGRYDRFMTDLAEEGWIVFGYDHLGHGGTARDESELGYIAPKDGWELLVKDVKAFSCAVRAEYDGTNSLPYCLMGHSMGSFIARLAAKEHVKPDRLIIMGTGGPNPAAGVGLCLIGLLKKIKGERHISDLIQSIAFGSYDKRFAADLKLAPRAWLTTDTNVRRTYDADPLCTFRFTVSAMGDLIRLIKYSNHHAWFEAIPKDLPILLVSGEDDPVGNYGKGIRTVEKRLKKTGARVECKLYSGARHEILNDFTYDTVKNDILAFCQ